MNLIFMITFAALCTSSQFRCDNGQCISSSLRCNGYTGGCTDDSDERGCCKLMTGPLTVFHFVAYCVITTLTLCVHY